MQTVDNLQKLSKYCFQLQGDLRNTKEQMSPSNWQVLWLKNKRAADLTIGKWCGLQTKEQLTYHLTCQIFEDDC